MKKRKEGGEGGFEGEGVEEKEEERRKEKVRNKRGGTVEKEEKKIVRIKNSSRREFTITVLKALAAGVLISAAFVAPNLIQLYNYFDMRNEREKRKLYFKLRSLERGGYITHKDGAYLLTDKGRKELTEAEVWDLKPAPQKASAGWYLVMYDLPAKKEKARQALRARLEELGFMKYQDSVYYHRLDHRAVLTPFAEFYGIRLHVRFAKAESLEGIDE
jgi:CRISPR/Cas system-associated protein endoribonuclease Cas2